MPKQQQRRGGAFIGKGTFGCSFFPHVPCETARQKVAPNTIGKVYFSEEDADTEKKIAKIMAKIDPRSAYFLYPKGGCAVTRATAERENSGRPCPLSQDAEKYMQLLMPNGGAALPVNLDKTYGVGNLNVSTIAILAEHMFKAVEKLLIARYVHQDIKPDNIVASSTAAGVLRIIDFGSLVKYDEFYDTMKNFMIAMNHSYAPNGPEYRLIHMELTGETILNEISLCDRQPGFHEIMKVQGLYGKSLEKLLGAFHDISTEARFDYLKTINAATKSDIYSCGMVLLFMNRYTSQQDNPAAISIFHELIRGCLMPHPSDRLDMTAILELVAKLKAAPPPKPTATPRLFSAMDFFNTRVPSPKPKSKSKSTSKTPKSNTHT